MTADWSVAAMIILIMTPLALMSLHSLAKTHGLDDTDNSDN